MPAADAVSPDRSPSLRECRARASFLLKQLHSAERERALRAAARFRVHPAFADLTPSRILAWRTDLRRKHALAVVAAELGYASWSALKAALDPTVPVLVPERLFTRMGSIFLNRWFRGYAEARAALAAGGGVLFPYRRQFVVCATEVLAALGLDAADPDWARIGWDWVQPRDAAAHRRLATRLEALGYARPAAPTASAASTSRSLSLSTSTSTESMESDPSMFTALGRMTLLVRDYDEALAFYRDVLGFVPLHDSTTPDGQRFLHVGLPAQDGAPPVGLWLLQPAPGDAALVGRQAGGQPLLVLYTADCGATIRQLAARGVRVLRPPAVQGGAVFAHVLDLYGNELVVAELGAAPR